MSQLAVILPAAGSSTRFGRNKLIEKLGDVPVLIRALRAFLDHPTVASIVVATQDVTILQMIRESKLERMTIAPGGASRAQSVQSALQMVPAHLEWVAVHDAARPLVSNDLIDRTLDAVSRQKAVAKYFV